MREVSYRWFENDPKTAETYSVSLAEFVYNVVSITESGIIPPLSILNERFASGGRCNPFGNVEWTPFEIDEDEYDGLVNELESLDPSKVWSHKGLVFVKLRLAPEFDSTTNSRRWTKSVSNKYSDEYCARLVELNAVEPQGSGSLSEEPDLGGELPDLREIRKILFELSADAVKRFAKEHEGKRFYAFGFDLNSTYGDVLLCANTQADYEKTAQRYVNDLGYSEKELEGLRSNFGDWRYQGFNLDYEEWNEGWEVTKLNIDGYVHLTDSESEVSDFLDSFIRTCSVVLLDLEAQGLLQLLNQQSGFFLQCIDHDENEHEAQQRFEEIRRARNDTEAPL